jgi:hypothetical protein
MIDIHAVKKTKRKTQSRNLFPVTTKNEEQKLADQVETKEKEGLNHFILKACCKISKSIFIKNSSNRKCRRVLTR